MGCARTSDRGNNIIAVVPRRVGGTRRLYIMHTRRLPEHMAGVLLLLFLFLWVFFFYDYYYSVFMYDSTHTRTYTYTLYNIVVRRVVKTRARATFWSRDRVVGAAEGRGRRRRAAWQRKNERNPRRRGEGVRAAAPRGGRVAHY